MSLKPPVAPNNPLLDSTNVQNVVDHGAGGGSLDTALASAADALGSNGGVIYVPSGAFTIAEFPSFAETRNILLIGEGGENAGANAPTKITYTGTADRAIDARSSFGFGMRDIQLVYNNASFTGTLIDISQSIAQDAAYGGIRDCYLGGSGTSTAAALILLNKAISYTVRSSHLDRAVVGIKGRNTAGDYSNVIGIDAVKFTQMGTASVQSAGQAWRLVGCTFQQLASGAAGAYVANGIGAAGVSFDGCWFGDANATGTWIDWKGSGLTVVNSYIGTGAVGVAFGASAFGAAVSGNQFAGITTAVTFAASCKAIDFFPNDFNAVTNKWTGTRPTACRLPGPTNDVVATYDAPAARVYHNTTQAVNAGVTTYLVFNSERFDNDTIHSTSADTGRLTCQTAGKYLIGFNGRWAVSNAGTYRYAELRLNGATRIATDSKGPNATVRTSHTLCVPYELAVGDYIEVGVSQDSGGSLNIDNQNNDSPEFWMVQVA